jgi:ketosteroid isomerase-like protein
MSEENVEVVRQMFEAFNSEDIDHIVSFAHPEVVVEIPGAVSAEPDTYRGPDGIRRYFSSFQDAMDEIRFEPERLWDVRDSDSVVVALRLTAKGRQTEIAVEQRTGAVWTVRDGKVVGVRTYASLSEALEAAGVRE